ncbi:hypothetical protein ACET3X_002916 [Alternaria dauci]|uniref:Rhodopsin domain-containing protein n=1 Tax=Alternaria dauci TaxID=48095 RepID=A0ABR3URB1_9PLEO
MSSSPYTEIISETQFLQVAYPMMALPSAFILVRIGIQVWKRKAMELQDYLMYTAYVFFLIMSICYLLMVPTVYAAGRVSLGQMKPWPTMQDDVLVYYRYLIVTTMTFWLTLWSVKLSLLALYKKLLEGLPAVYKRLWWAVFWFCIVSLIGCLVSYFTSCPSFVKFMTKGECSGPRAIRGQLASLYMTYGVDILSDFMIMFLPIRLVWNLQMARAQKIAIIALFASAVVCTIFATLRVVQVGIRAGSGSSPSPSWLSLWSIIEAAVAVCIGCGPAFAVFYRNAHTPHVSYDTSEYVRHNQSRSGANANHTDAIKMNVVTISSGRKKVPRRDVYWDDTRSSQEQLAADDKNIMVTTTLRQDARHSNLGP